MRKLWKKNKNKYKFKMLSVKYAQMVTTQKIILLFFVQCAISVCIKDALVWLRFQLIVGYAKFVLLSVQLVSMFLVLSVM